MKVYNPKSNFILTTEILNLIHVYRKAKNFNPNQYIKIKAELLNKYMTKFGLKSCVIAVSGGIDSALVLSLVHYASQLKNSPIKKIIAVSLPVSNSEGATGQDSATSRAKELCDSLNIKQHVIELNSAHHLLEQNVSQSLNIESDSWALGQLVAHTRTPTLYYTATLLTQEGFPAIIVGTTNRDEGLYLGYFGKASDGLVDVQLISDLHKSEVYLASVSLNVPESILTVSPQGDMYDGRVDEEVFGASYDFVEFYLHYMTLTKDLQSIIFNQLSNDSQEQFLFLKTNLDNLHKYNRHKYFSASPAVHLDINNMLINEGWKTNCLFAKPTEKLIQYDKIVGLFPTNNLPTSFFKTQPIDVEVLTAQKHNIIHLSNVLSKNECQWLINETNNQNWLPANLYGKQKDFDSLHEQPMSHRLSTYNNVLSYTLFNRIGSFIDNIKQFSLPLPIIANNSDIWSAVGINPLFRYIRYQKGNSLIVHYDDTYEYNNNKKTLLTMVIYLDDNSALTRFISDPQIHKPDQYKDFSDWNCLANDNEVLCSVQAKAGDVLLFDHRLLHDATSPDSIKHILRTDIIFESPTFGFDL